MDNPFFLTRPSVEHFKVRSVMSFALNRIISYHCVTLSGRVQFVLVERIDKGTSRPRLLFFGAFWTPWVLKLLSLDVFLLFLCLLMWSSPLLIAHFNLRSQSEYIFVKSTYQDPWGRWKLRDLSFSCSVATLGLKSSILKTSNSVSSLRFLFFFTFSWFNKHDN